MADGDGLAKSGLFIVRNFLDVETCLRIRVEARNSADTIATVVRKGESIVAEQMRRTKQAEVSPATVAAVQERLELLIPALDSHFMVQLTRCQPPQFLKYKKGDFFRPHQDNGQAPDMPEYLRQRKVTAVIFLNTETRAPGEDVYGGGVLTFYRLFKNPNPNNVRTHINGEAGLLVGFRSDVYHEVTRIIHGERYTITAWFE